MGPEVSYRRPRRADFDTQELWDAKREPWYAALMGRLLPPYGDNERRAAAWRHALLCYERARYPRKQSEAADAAQEQNARMQLTHGTALLADKEREWRDSPRYHVACNTWHHPDVPCAAAAHYPLHRCPPLSSIGGTVHVQGKGAVLGKMALPDFLDVEQNGYCTMWDSGRSIGVFKPSSDSYDSDMSRFSSAFGVCDKCGQTHLADLPRCEDACLYPNVLAAVVPDQAAFASKRRYVEPHW